MSILEIILVAISLAMDALAVSVASGVALKEVKAKQALKFGVFFGVFQFIMPVLGYFLGTAFKDYITAIDHWIAFILLAFIGGNMLREALGKEKECVKPRTDADILKWQNMLLMAIATSIDALAVGISFSLFGVNILLAAGIIGAVAFGLSFIGVLLGKRLGCLFKKGAEVTGGLILIGIGLKILIEHLFF